MESLPEEATISADTPTGIPPAVKATVVIPCFNEAARLDGANVLRLTESGACDVLLVDDGSRDETVRRVRELEASSAGRVRVLELGANRGKGEAVRRGLLQAISQGAPIVGYLDADFATPPGEMLRLIEQLKPGGPRFALASRVALLGRDIRRSVSRHYLGRIFASAASLSLDMRVYDTQCGAKAMRVDETIRAALSEPFTTRWVFDVELLMRLTRPGGFSENDFIEMPLRQWSDVEGSKLTGRAMAGAFRDLVRLGWTERRARARQPT